LFGISCTFAALQNTVSISANNVSRLQSLLGDNAETVSRSAIPVNRYINAEWLQVAYPETEMPEDSGRLHLFPIDDNKFCLQLAYLLENQDTDTATVCLLQFLPAFFDQYPVEVLMANQPFRFDQTTEQQFSICSQSRLLLEQLQQKASTAFLQALQQSEVALQLLRRALECITTPFAACQVPACRFLAHETEREKIIKARRILEQRVDQPFTIRELSRKVAMNECYLKKGFKTLTGKTIYEYQHELRISKAKHLLQQDGQSVSDVANTLGYSSISHFSTAFKKATGMKPCELLK